MQRNTILFIIIILASVLAFILDLILGSVAIPLSDVWDAVWGQSEQASWNYIVSEFRLPKAITTCFVGAGVAITGLQMQTLFRNPLADTSILGIGHGASLGVAIFVLLPFMLPGILPNAFLHHYWGMILASVLGALGVLLLISLIASWMQDMIALLIVGVMIGLVAGALVSVLQYFSSPEAIQYFLVWTFGSLSGTTWTQLYFLMPIVGLSIILSLLLPKNMNALLLGENYAKSSGVNVQFTRFALIALTGVITGTLTAFVGPIAFIGIAVPHVARIIFKTANHQVLISASLILGVLLMLVCDIISQLPPNGVILPINAVTSILGAPIVILIIIKNRSKKTIF